MQKSSNLFFPLSVAILIVGCLDYEYNKYGSLSFKIKFADGIGRPGESQVESKINSAGNLSSEISYVRITVGVMEPVNISVNSGTAQTTIDNIPVGFHVVIVELQNNKTETLYQEFKTVLIEVEKTATPSFDNFSLVETILVNEPDGGESFDGNEITNIKWSGNHESIPVIIDLFKSGVLLINLSDNQENNGSFFWTTPTFFSTSSDYKIRITSSNNSTIYDESNDFFTIQSPLFQYEGFEEAGSLSSWYGESYAPGSGFYQGSSFGSRTSTTSYEGNYSFVNAEKYGVFVYANKSIDVSIADSIYVQFYYKFVCDDDDEGNFGFGISPDSDDHNLIIHWGSKGSVSWSLYESEPFYVGENDDAILRWRSYNGNNWQGICKYYIDGISVSYK